MSENIEETDNIQLTTYSEKNKVGLGFSMRDTLIKKEEKKGFIEYLIISNDKQYQSMKFLIDLKNIFSKQLPRMPKEYIVRLMFNSEHRSMIILKNKAQIVGGICYRLFRENSFAEVVFLAISSTDQIKGYGTRLMNRFKDKMQQEKIKTLLTYADNSAIGYFKKQGFHKDIRFEEENWKGRIKEYDGGTFMECQVHETFSYTKISKYIKKQKKYVTGVVKKLCINPKQFPGIDIKNFPLKDVENIQGLKMSGLDVNDLPKEIPTYKDKDLYQSFKIQCQKIITILKRNKNSWPFLEPVDSAIVPDYYDVIKNPIDIKTITERINSHYYKNDKNLFAEDVKRMFENAQIYNQQQTIYYKIASDLSKIIEPHLIEFLNKN